MICAKCNTDILGDDGSEAGCSKCLLRYHISCLTLSRQDHRLIRNNSKHFICPSCKTESRNKKDDPPTGTPSQPTQNETDRAAPNFLSAVSGLKSMAAPAEVIASFTAALTQMQGVFTAMKNDMSAFTESLNSTSMDIAQFRQDMTEIKTQLKDLNRYKEEVKTLRAEVAELRQELSAKEQRGLRKDIEITGVTEHKGENLMQIVNVISTKLGVELDQRDVDDVRRVGMYGGGQGGAPRPRPVVLTFTRRAPRDDMIRAARARRGLTTESLDIAGPSRRVFINEHLTKENRVLFSKARGLGAKLGFKHTWTTNGRILMRRTDTSSILHVESESVLNKLGGGSDFTQGLDQSTPSQPLQCS